MTANDFLTELDNLFDTGMMDKVEAFIVDSTKTARASNNYELLLTIYNEAIGFYREMCDFEKGSAVIDDTIKALNTYNYSDMIGVGTTFLNIATLYRTMGKYDLSKEYYDKVLDIYKDNLPYNDLKLASLYNNMSILYETTGDYDESAKLLKDAFSVLCANPDSREKIAITHTNLGLVLIKAGKLEEAEKELMTGYNLFKSKYPDDYHFCGCANALGNLYVSLSQYDDALKYYEEALVSVYDSMGITGNFLSIQENYKLAYEKSGGVIYNCVIDMCKAYYEKYGKPMIDEKFFEYKDAIAVGLCGEGSQCFGYEDKISFDHDCGPGFSMWVDDDVYEAIGEKLQQEYKKLPRVFAGYIKNDTAMAGGRLGVCKIKDFYNRVLGGILTDEDFDCLLLDVRETDAGIFQKTEEFALAAATNGCVFEDKQGKFSCIRNKLLKYYPDRIWKEKIAKSLLKCAQSGQYNYTRSMARADYVTANIALAQYMEEIMHLVFLLNRKYSPYYKWQNRALADLLILPEIGDFLKAICDMGSQREAYKDFRYNGNPNKNDMIAMTIEIIAKMVVNELNNQHLYNGNDAYLETAGKEILMNMSEEPKQQTVEDLAMYITKLEWNAFDKVQNEGGRATCQDDWETFSIMRMSQYLNWPYEMLSEYVWYFEDCMKKGRNLITEKYGRMMESTVPWEWENIKDNFPVLSDERKAIMEAIIKIQVNWMEEFALEYPKLATNARSIHTSEDRVFNTSYETYLRGELSTYSDELIAMYGRFIATLASKGDNLAYLTMEQTAKLYGYKSLKDAEEKL